jgi:hypothetical protein
VKAASITFAVRAGDAPGHMIMDWWSREPLQVGHRRRVAVLAEGQCVTAAGDRVIFRARDRSGRRAQFSAFTFAGNGGPIAAMAGSAAVEAVHYAKTSLGWSAYINSMREDYDGFAAELAQIGQYLQSRG